MTLRDYRKIGFKDGAVTLRWEVMRRGGTETQKSELESKDPPLASFHEALAAFGPWVADALELPSADGLSVRSVSINHEEDRRGFVVTCLRALPATFNAPLVLNTPHLRELGDEEFGPGFADDDLVALVDALEKEADRYLKGERQQGELFPAA